MGGEPLCDENAFPYLFGIKEVKRKFQEAKVYIWSGYTYEEFTAASSSRVLACGF